MAVVFFENAVKVASVLPASIDADLATHFHKAFFVVEADQDGNERGDAFTGTTALNDL